MTHRRGSVAQRRALREHRTFLQTLHAGEFVTLTMGGQALYVRVVYPWHSADWDDYGQESFRVTVGYGIGRWITHVYPSSLMPVVEGGLGYTLTRSISWL
jgi:hypothetical protein